jgi:hypothetical protein
MKPVLMIHEVREWMFDLPLEDYIITFDDGLYSQYYYRDKFLSIDTPKIYFISSGIVCDDRQSTDFPSCEVAHEKAFNGNYEDYMTINQIEELMADPNVTIGGHSHSHTNLNQIPDLFSRISHIESDTKQMINWFKDTLNFVPSAFCFPYNNDLDNMYKGLLKKYGFTEYYGNERIPIEYYQKTY